MSLLPAAAQPLVAAPLRALMEPSHALADLYHASPPPVWRPDLVPRIASAVAAVPTAAYDDEGRAAVALGAVTVWGLMHNQGGGGGDKAAERAHVQLAPLRTPPPPPPGTAPLRNAERIGVARVPQPDCPAALHRWAWDGGAATAPTTMPAVAAGAVPPPMPLPPPVLPAVTDADADATAALLAMLQIPPQPSAAPPAPPSSAPAPPPGPPPSGPPPPSSLPLPSMLMKR